MPTTTTKSYQAINFAEKLGSIGEYWSPRVVAELNDYQFKVVRIEGDFIWEVKLLLIEPRGIRPRTFPGLGYVHSAYPTMEPG